LDIFIPSLNLAIEFNGTFWHSEISGNKNKVYHLNKTKSCIFKGIKLIHIFQFEWDTKKEIIKSILKNIIKKTPNKIYARECEVRDITLQCSIDFLEKNHLQGKDKSSIKLGLYHKNELVSVMTFCKSRFDKKCEYEMSRYCNNLNTSIIGGGNKLFSHFINSYRPNSMVSYSDRRYFNGNIYRQLGFTFVDNTSPSYFYLKEYKIVFNRINFQKHKLKKVLSNFDDKLSEWENMKINGFDRIWDCGHSKWVIKFNYPTKGLKNNSLSLDSIKDINSSNDSSIL